MPRILQRNYPYSLNLSDNTHSVTIPNTANLTYGTSSMSFAFWFTPNDPILATTNVIIETDASAYTNGVMISHYGRNLYVYVQNGASSYQALGFFADEKVGEWQRVVVTVSNVDYKIRVYKNGVLWGTSAAITPWNITSTVVTRIGASGDLPQATKGKYADVCFMKGTVPTDQQISDDYFLNKTLPNINHRYALDEGSGTSTIDSIGGNTGTINNGALYTTYSPMKTRNTASGRIAVVTKQNLFRDSNNLTTASWSTDAQATVAQVAGITLPDGAVGTVTRLTGASTAQRYARNSGYYPITTPGQHTISAWVRTVAGDTQVARLTLAAGGVSVGPNVNVTGTWQRLTFTDILLAGNVLSFVGNGSGNNAIDVYIYNPQIVKANFAGPDKVTSDGNNYNVGDLRNIVITQQNLFVVSEPQALGDIYSHLNVTVDNYIWPSQIVTPKAITFGDNTASRTSYMYYAGGDGITPHTFAIDVVMNDSSAPVALASAGTSDFQLYFNGAIVNNAVTTSLGGNLYRVSCTGIPTSGNVLYGLLKTGSHSAKGFKVSGFHMVKGNQLGAYIKTYGAAYNVGNLRNIP